MNEAKKTFDPFILLFSAVYLIVLLLSLYTHMYYGEYSTRDLSQEIYRYAISKEEPTQWMLQYREEVLSRIEEENEAHQEGLFGKLDAEALVLNRVIKSFSHVEQLQDLWEREAILAQRAAKRRLEPDQSETIKSAYSNLVAPEYGNYQPFEDLIEWNRSYGWLILVLLCFVCARVYPMEYTTGMSSLLFSVALHPGRIARKKISAVFIFTFGVLTILWASEISIAIYMAGSSRELLQSAQALFCMDASRLSLRVWEVILYQYGAAFCLSIFFNGAILFFSAVLRNTMNTLLLGIVVLALSYGLSQIFPTANLLDARRYLGVTELLQKADASIYWVSAILTIIGLALAIASILRFRRNRDA